MPKLRYLISGRDEIQIQVPNGNWGRETHAKKENSKPYLKGLQIIAKYAGNCV